MSLQLHKFNITRNKVHFEILYCIDLDKKEKGSFMIRSFRKIAKLLVICFLFVAMVGSLSSCTPTSRTYVNGDRSIKVTTSSAKLTKFYYEDYNITASGTYTKSGTSVSIKITSLSIWKDQVFTGTIDSAGTEITAYGVKYTSK